MFLTFDSLDHFESELRNDGLPCDTWGVGPTKTILELEEEHELQSSRFIRTTAGKILRLKYGVRANTFFPHRKRGLLVLQEKKQIFLNGSIRKRPNRCLYEKVNIRDDETWERALVRLHWEELGIDDISEFNYVQIERSPLKVKLSDSYPGLPSVRVGPTYAGVMPKKFFREDGYVALEARRTTYSGWRKAKRKLKLVA